MATPVVKKPTKQEQIKEESAYLRGKLAEELADPNPYVSDESYELLKFHGSYQGYDRDTATARKQQGLEKEYEFMVRLKMPGGIMTAEQYLAMDHIVDRFANGTLRITTRETFQFHCIVKEHMKPLIAEINHNLLSTLGGCGDIVRNIMTSSAPFKNKRYERLRADTDALARHLAPRTEGYLDVWLDGEFVEGWGSLKGDTTYAPKNSEDLVEPIYGPHYMPRKFKICVTAPEDNSMDALSNDLAIFALFNAQDELEGYNFYLGGGMGMQHNNAKTYPRLASPVAFVGPNDLLRGAEAVVKLQRDFGDRTDRRHSRLKYVVQERGPEWTRKTFEEYFGAKLEDVRPMPAFGVPDWLGWHEQGDGKWWLGVPVPSGRIMNYRKERIRSGLREAIERFKPSVILTADQNILLGDIEAKDKAALIALLKEHHIALHEDITPFDRWALACVSLPTCGKALAEAERIRNPLVIQTEEILTKLGLRESKITLSISGCPNGCSRPYSHEIGIVGRTPENYAIFIGGRDDGTRLNEKIFDKLPFEWIPTALEAMFALYKDASESDESFGDFCHRHGIQAVREKAKIALYEKFNWEV